MLSRSTSSSQSSISDSEPATFGSITPAIRRCKKYQVIAFGINDAKYKPDQNLAHRELLSGIVGKELPPQLECFCFKENEVKVKVNFGSYEACRVTQPDIDLLLLFLPTSDGVIHRTCTEQIDMISEKMGDKVWEHAIVILTGVDASIDELKQKDWTKQVQQAIRPHTKRQVQVVLAGSRHQPDLPNEKWFSKLWLICFKVSNIKSKPALLKIAQRRVRNKLESTEITGQKFFEQPIEIKENSVELPKSLKLGLGIGGGGAIAGAAAAGATTGALIGALAIGIPSFGVAAGAGLAIGAVVGGGVGAGIAGAAVGRSYQLAKEKQMEEISMEDLGKYYDELLTRIPKMKVFLESWAEKQINCKIVVAGTEHNDVSTVAAGITGIAPRREGSGLYWKQITPWKTNLIVHDFSRMSQNCTDPKLGSKDVYEHLRAKEMHLIIICIPMTSSKDRFAESVHATYLSELCKINNHILSNAVIILSQANKMWDEMKKQSTSTEMSFQQFFYNEVEEWKKIIENFLDENDDCLVENVLVIPAADHEPSINLSDQGTSPTACYHWLSELLLQAMSVTKLEGLPALIRTNRKRMVDFPDQYPHQETEDEFVQLCKCIEDPELQPAREQREDGETTPEQVPDPPPEQPAVMVPQPSEEHEEIIEHHQLDQDRESTQEQAQEAFLKRAARRVHQLMIEAQCLMLSQIGLREKRHPGQAIGYILGVHKEQNW